MVRFGAGRLLLAGIVALAAATTMLDFAAAPVQKLVSAAIVLRRPRYLPAPSFARPEMQAMGALRLTALHVPWYSSRTNKSVRNRFNRRGFL